MKIFCRNKQQAYYDFTTLDGGTIRFGKEGDQIFYERRGFGRTPEKHYLVTEDNKIGIEVNGGGGEEQILKTVTKRITAAELKNRDFGADPFEIMPGVAGKLLMPVNSYAQYTQIGDPFTSSEAGIAPLYIGISNNIFAFDFPMLNFALSTDLVTPQYCPAYETDLLAGPNSLFDTDLLTGEGLFFYPTATYSGDGAHGHIDIVVKYVELDVYEKTIPVFANIQLVLVPGIMLELDPGHEATFTINDLISSLTGGSSSFQYQVQINDEGFVTIPTTADPITVNCSYLGTNEVFVRVIDKVTLLSETVSTFVIVSDSMNPCP